MQNEKSKFKKEFIARLINLTLRVIRVGVDLEKQRVMWKIVDQLVGSAGSIGANVVEAKSSSSRREYKKYFEIALKSANETIYWLLVVKGAVRDIQVLKEVESVYEEAIEISKVLGASVLTLKNSR
jgi:four helix bundle protein